MQVIVYTNAEGGVSIMTPALECGLSIEEIAEKDVPKDARPYLIIDDSKLPDRGLRDRWVLKTLEGIIE